MPLYEGTTLILEKQAVVLDIGARYTKFGFTGEASPRCIVPSEFPCERTRRPRRVLDYSTPEELRDNLLQMLHLLYFRHVLVNPKDRKVVVVEWLLTPTLFRETLAKVLYCHYEVSSVVWAPSTITCSIALGGPPAVLVVELGWEEACVCGVVHSVPVLHALASQPLAARAIHDTLRKLLKEDNPHMPELPDNVLEDIKIKTCFVTKLERAQAYESGNPPAPPPEVRYPLRDETILVSGRTRELAAECLFPRDNEHAGLAETILDTILRCPVDTRRPLAENLLITGGTAMLPGVKSRLVEELRHHLRLPRYERLHIESILLHTPPAKDNYTAWLGGAILGATEALNSRALTREAYYKEQRVRDWVNLLDNTPPSNPHWTGMSL